MCVESGQNLKADFCNFALYFFHLFFYVYQQRLIDIQNGASAASITRRFEFKGAEPS